MDLIFFGYDFFDRYVDHWFLGFLFLVCTVVVVHLLSHIQLWLLGLQHASLVYLSLSPWVCSYSCPLSQQCHPTISSSLAHLSCPQSFPATGSFLMRQLFESGGQSIGASAIQSVLRMNIQGWFPLGLTGLISLLSKGLPRVFSSTIVWKHQFFSSQPSLWSNSHIHTWLLEKPDLWLDGPLLESSVFTL